MASFDVSSLFTNIPLKKSIDLAVSYIFEGNTKLKFSRAELVKMFSIATSQTHFLFHGKVFDQIDGVAMGSPLAPVLANLFLGHHENMWFQNYQGPSVPFYRRYVDDTFWAFNTENECVVMIATHLVSKLQLIGKRPSLDYSLISSALHPSLIKLGSFVL